MKIKFSLFSKEDKRVTRKKLETLGIIIRSDLDGKCIKCFVIDGKRYLVERIRVIGTGILSYAVWERTGKGKHFSTRTTYINDSLPLPEKTESKNVVRWGKVGSRYLPAFIDSLEGEERIEGVKAFYDEQYKFAYSLIKEAFPEASLATKTLGEMSLSFQYPFKRREDNIFYTINNLENK
jgi:hypothetical protein